MQCCCCQGSGSVEGYGICPLCDGDATAMASDDEDVQFAQKLSETFQRRQDAEKGFNVTVAETLLSGLTECNVPTDAALTWSVRVSAENGAGLYAGIMESMSKTNQNVAPIVAEAGQLILGEQPIFTVQGTEEVRESLVREQEELANGASVGNAHLLNMLYSRDVRLSRIIAHALAKLDDSSQNKFLQLSDGFSGGPSLSPGVWVQLADDKMCLKNGKASSHGFIVQATVAEGEEHFTVEVRQQLICGLNSKDLVVLSSGKTLGGIFLTNAVSDSDKSADISYVYPLTSRINHSCCPNAMALQHKGNRFIFAKEAIRAGEEIYISYIDTFEHSRHSEFRSSISGVAEALSLDPKVLLVGLFRQQLFLKWNFWCQCRRCAPVAQESDAALAEFEEF
eukprot:TRINITY_DN30668_c0_g1_i1.p1 TRINITY_DN30668_c0_g1~~TRINITY_DN30668_c0_g1_i1.p1  ORF type:complete len:395 (-),score=83.46 TRINITY_DN30668_c0_g1_i1:468-1652(-)